MLKYMERVRSFSKPAAGDVLESDSVRAAAQQALERRIGKIVGRAGENLSGPGYLRNAKRVPVRRVGVITLKSGAVVDCMVEDFSATGFRLELHEPKNLPPVFMLTVPSLQMRYIVVRRWMNGLAIGVEIRRRINLPRA
jgi:hypothetical protein